MVDLPKELLVEIMSRLPVESLARFKCVSRSWYALLESPKFVSQHIAKQCKDHVILMHYKGTNYISFLYHTGNYCDDVSYIVDWDLDLKLDLFIHGYCDGVVLLTDPNGEIVLCNPATREVRVLPKYRTSLQYIAGQGTLHTGAGSIGIGYDSQTEDYKVVRVESFWTDAQYNFNLPRRAEVFSLRASSSWREIEGVVGVQLYYNDDMEQYFDGFYYWFGIDEDTQKHVVVSFDMSDEVFKKAPNLDVCDTKENEFCLGVFKTESIALFVWPKHGCEKCIDVWVMKEFSVTEFWTKKLTIGPLRRLHRPLVFWKNDKELLHEDTSCELASYDLATLESKTLTVHNEVGDITFSRTYLYMKTLVSVNGTKNTTF